MQVWMSKECRLNAIQYLLNMLLPNLEIENKDHYLFTLKFLKIEIEAEAQISVLVFSPPDTNAGQSYPAIHYNKETTRSPTYLTRLPSSFFHQQTGQTKRKLAVSSQGSQIHHSTPLSQTQRQVRIPRFSKTTG